MVSNLLQRLPINDDVEAEFTYWKDQFLFAIYLAAGIAVATALLIALWPQSAGNSELRSFARHFWTLLAECAFWFGFLLGLLWGAVRRIAAGLTGTLPWKS